MKNKTNFEQEMKLYIEKAKKNLMKKLIDEMKYFKLSNRIKRGQNNNL